MSAAQLAYVKNTANALDGLVADIGPYEIESFTNQVGLILFGLAVQFGASENEAILGSGVGGAGFIGIATRKTVNENTVVGGEEERYNENETMGVIRRGNVWVRLAAGGSPGDNIFVIDATGVLDVGVAGAGESDVGILQTTAVATGLGLLRLNG